MAQAATQGTLRIEVIEARLTRDTEAVGQMDPYCVIETGEQKFQTRILEGAGKTPKWNQAFNIEVKDTDDDISIKVLDEDVRNDDVVGGATFKISSLCSEGGFNRWLPIYYEDAEAGDINLKCVWTPVEDDDDGGIAAVPKKQEEQEDEIVAAPT